MRKKLKSKKTNNSALKEILLSTIHSTVNYNKLINECYKSIKEVETQQNKNIEKTFEIEINNNNVKKELTDKEKAVEHFINKYGNKKERRMKIE